MKIPSAVQDVTPEWLTQALREAGIIDRASVSSLDIQLFEGQGFVGQVARVVLRYDQLEEGAPGSLIVKLPSADETRRADVARRGLYEREIRFYEELADQIELRTPRLYYSAMDTEAEEYVLLIEDMAPARVGDNVAGCSLAEAELAIRNLARIHAAWWESPRLAGLDWLPVFYADPEQAQTRFGESWGPFLERFGDMMPASMTEVGEKLKSNVAYVVSSIGESPRTLIHGDFRLDNLFFSTDEDGIALAAADWQTVSQSKGVFDVAYFLAWSLQPEQRRAKEMELLGMYHSMLLDSGVAGYDFDQCLKEYRLFMLFTFIRGVLVGANVDLSHERVGRLLRTLLERTVAAVLDLKSVDLLPSA